MVRDVRIDGDDVALEVTLTVAGCPLRNEIQNRVTGALTAIGVRNVDLSFGVMTDEQRAKVRETLHGDPSASAGSQQAHGHAEGRAIPFADPRSEEHTSELQSLMRISYAVFCLKKKKKETEEKN